MKDRDVNLNDLPPSAKHELFQLLRAMPNGEAKARELVQQVRAEQRQAIEALHPLGRMAGEMAAALMRA